MHTKIVRLLLQAATFHPARQTVNISTIANVVIINTDLLRNKYTINIDDGVKNS